MKKLIILLLISSFISCTTRRIIILDGNVVNQKKVLGIVSKDTIEYITLHSGEVITINEFNKRWDDTVNKTTKKLKSNNK